MNTPEPGKPAETLPAETLTETLTRLYGWDTLPHTPDTNTTELATGRTYLDGEPVIVNITVEHPHLIVSDSGETYRRFTDADIPENVSTELITLICDTYKIFPAPDHLFTLTETAGPFAAHHIARFADMLIAADALTLTA